MIPADYIQDYDTTTVENILPTDINIVATVVSFIRQQRESAHNTVYYNQDSPLKKRLGKVRRVRRFSGFQSDV